MRRRLLGLVTPLAVLLLASPATAALDEGRGDPFQAPVEAVPGPEQPHPRKAGATPKCPPELSCNYIPAAYAENGGPTSWGNYDLAKRPGDGLDIDRIVIHDTETSYEDAIDIFQNSSSYVSAHYVVRSDDGFVTQMVPLRDVAYHAGNYYYNQHSIGIEIEGFATEGNTWYTPEVYESVAALVAYLSERYDIPLDRDHVFGHDQIPGPNLTYQAGMHWDPGPFFNWDRLMRLAGADKPPARGVPEAGDAVVIRPDYWTNEPPVSSCETADDETTCTDLPAQPASFVYLHTKRFAGSPYPSDTFLSGTSAEPDGVGTTQADDWGNKAVAGQTFIVAKVKGDWTAIWYGSKRLWFYNPDGINTSPTEASYAKVRNSKNPIPVWGAAYPSKLQNLSLGYSIPKGQKYAVTGPVPTDRYVADLYDDLSNYYVDTGKSVYYQVQYNHRQGFVLAKDVKIRQAG